MKQNKKIFYTCFSIYLLFCFNLQCQNILDLSEKHFVALNFVVKNDTAFTDKKIKVSNKTCCTYYSSFYDAYVLNSLFVPKENQKQSYPQTSITEYCPDNEFYLPGFINTSNIDADITIFFSEIYNNELFIVYTSCFPYLPYYYGEGMYSLLGLEIECNDKNIYYFIFNDNDEIDKVYKSVRNKDRHYEVTKIK